MGDIFDGDTQRKKVATPITCPNLGVVLGSTKSCRRRGDLAEIASLRDIIDLDRALRSWSSSSSSSRRHELVSSVDRSGQAKVIGDSSARQKGKESLARMARPCR